MVATPASYYVGSPLQRSDIANFIPQIWIGEVRRYRDRMFHLAKGTKTFNFLGKKGDTLHIPLVTRAGVRDRIPGQSVHLQSRQPGQYRITVDQDKESSFSLDRMVDIQSQYAIRQLYTQEAGYAMARDLDNALLALRAALPATQKIFKTTTGTAAGDPQALDEATILAALQLMMESNVPLEQCMWIFSPNQVLDIWTLDRFTSNDFNLAQLNLGTFSSGVVGRLYNLPVMVTNQITNNTLVGYISEEGAAGQPTPGVAGSPYLPTQESIVGTGLERGKTGSEVAQPFQTGMLVHPDWSILIKQSNINATASFENLLQMEALVTTHTYGTKTYRQDHAVLLFTQGT